MPPKAYAHFAGIPIIDKNTAENINFTPMILQLNLTSTYNLKSIQNIIINWTDNNNGFTNGYGTVWLDNPEEAIYLLKDLK